MLKVEERGAEETSKHLREIGERSLDARPAMRRIREIMEKGNRRNFESRGGYFGSSWDGLADSTRERKARRGQSSTPLRATGALKSSLSGGKGRRGGATRSSARAGTSIWYAVFAEAGTTKAPKREIVGISKRDLERSEKLLENFLTSGRL